MVDKSVRQLIESFLNDPELIYSLNWNRHINPLEIYKINEPKHSAFISWLLDPEEAHGQGDFFIKNLLKECLTGDKEYSKFPNRVGILEINSIALTTSYVFTELKAGISNGTSNPRIDIAVIDDNTKTAIFIENKYGAKVDKKQLNSYNKYLTKHYGKVYNCVFVLLDLEKHDDLPTPWYSVDYSWLELSIKSILTQYPFESPIRRLLLDYYSNLTTDFSLDPYHQNCLKHIKNLSQNHTQLLDMYNNIQIKNTHILDLQLEDVINYTGKNADTINALYNLYLRYDDILIEMQSYGFYEFVSDRLEKALPVVNYDEIVEIEPNCISITTENIIAWNHDSWCAYIYYWENSKVEGRPGTIWFFTDFSLVPKTNAEKIESYLRKFRNRVNRNGKNNIKLRTYPVRPSIADLVGALKYYWKDLETIN